MRRAKIICTIGPSTSSEEAIENLILAGMNVARINFSHGDHDFFRTVINRVRSVAARLNKSVGVLQDLQGPKIRTAKMKDDKIVLRTGETTIITTENILGTAKKFASQYKDLAKDVSPEDMILLDDGKIALRCISVENEQEITCEIVHGGILKSNKGINVPNGGLSTPSLTKKDIRDLHFGAQVGIDAIALSFVRSAEDVRMLRRELSISKTKPLVIAKIEKQQAIENFDDILNEVDGVMVARGDLGVEMALEKVPTAQKRITEKAIARGKFVIVATQMLESMITQPLPTRAETSDVANAVLDGADMLMLSAETAAGEFPIEAVKTMDRIIRHVESSELPRYWRTNVKLHIAMAQQYQNIVSLAATRAAEELGAKVIAIYTSSGATARLVSDYRPHTPIIAFVPNIAEQRRLCFVWGVETCIINHPADSESLIKFINEKLQTSWHLSPDDAIVLLTKVPLQSSQRTNTIHIHNITRLID